MLEPILEIKPSKKGAYYEMYVNGKHVGNYDSVVEAAKDYEAMQKEEAEANAG